MIRNMIFWFCVPWVAFIAIATLATGIHKPGVMPMLLLVVVLIGFATRAEYRKAKAKIEAELAAAQRRARDGAGGDGVRHSGAAEPTAFNLRRPGQFTSFAFRYGLPPDVLKRKDPKVLPPPPRALPPPAADE
jgi:uncharacterized membrane protein